ncbi:DUF4040 domain-containing protein [Thermosipho ferrireducens]|uniref:DUF4040 domain-containing protein n=1 Tax=Thermosipho ferrireducens TaxID=2571116 RepID=A0ABX7S6X0_9BACT|nr:hydrogenase subunit MbhD domain-containing protein [Thermosipho ferrireducens]QTA37596.1 DUF4040 domain-containing protein [Thermosipho ferrireducens]
MQIVRVLFLLVAVLFASLAIIRIKPFHSFLWRTALSILAVAIYTLYFAPDVALAEAMLGALLTTFVYLLAIKIHSKVRVGIIVVPVICEKYGDSYVGIIPGIMEAFAKKYNHKIEYVEFEDYNQIAKAVNEAVIDIGISYSGDFPIIEVPVYEYNGKKSDYFSLQKILEENPHYGKISKITNAMLYFSFNESDSILFEEFEEFFETFEKEKIVNKYLRR